MLRPPNLLELQDLFANIPDIWVGYCALLLEQLHGFRRRIAQGDQHRRPHRHAAVRASEAMRVYLAPGFDFSDFEMANREILSNEFPQHKGLIMRLTRG